MRFLRVTESWSRGEARGPRARVSRQEDSGEPSYYPRIGSERGFAAGVTAPFIGVIMNSSLAGAVLRRGFFAT